MPEPGWTFTTDSQRYASAALDFLRTNPIGNTVALGVAIRLERGPRESQPGDCYGWWTNAAGEVEAAFSTQPPFAVTLSARVPEEAARSLASAWLESGRARPSAVFGEVKTAESIAADWAQRTGGTYRIAPQHEMRLFEFAEPTPPNPAPHGEFRLAKLDDLPLLVPWDEAFLTDCGIPLSPNLESAARARIADGCRLLWAVDGAPVAMANYAPVVAQSTRITGVYTPPEHRGHGYASGITWAVTQAALADGAKHVLLHTDLSNPTSNKIYQRLGYRPVHDVTEFDLED
jgi:RimJ/RimL family protein N-acetyltransferase